MASKFNPRDVLASNRRNAIQMVNTVGVKRTRDVLEASERDLVRRVRGVQGAGEATFTNEQLKATLVQVRAVLKDLKPALRETMVDGAGELAETAADGVVQYLTAADDQFRGVGSQPLALDEAAVMDEAKSGAQSSILRRLASSGEPVVGADGIAHKAKIGILDRYGLNVIGDFESTLQQGLLQRKSFDDIRTDIIAQSTFLQGKPASWSERIVRTELAGAYNRASWEGMREADEQLGDMLKILSSTFDSRTGSDSFACHGEIRQVDEAFETWFGLMQHPPDRPNDRGIVVPHRMSWAIPPYLRWRDAGQIAARWKAEGRKGRMPPRPLMTTVPLDQIG